MNKPHVEHIHIAGGAGAPMRRLSEATAIKGLGLAGDRYWARAGFCQDSRVSRDLTLIEGESIDHIANELGAQLDAGETRRNITTRGIYLNSLVGTTFWVGEVLAMGADLCEPCRHLVELTGRQLLRPMVHRGGLRADLLSSGRLREGDPIDVVELQPGVGVIVMQDDRVLIGKRLAAHGFGTWSFPGGKPLIGESNEECAIRELSEETGLVGASPRVVGTTLDGFKESRVAFRTTFVVIPVVQGELKALEPRKTSAWSWLPWRSLPTPLFAPVASLVASGYDPIHDR